MEAYREELDLARDMQDSRLEIMALGGLGHAALVDGESEEALSRFEEGLTVARKIPLPFMVAQLLFDRAQALDALSERQNAIASAEEAVKVRESIEAPEVPGLQEWLAERRAPGDACKG